MGGSRARTGRFGQRPRSTPPRLALLGVSTVLARAAVASDAVDVIFTYDVATREDERTILLFSNGYPTGSALDVTAFAVNDQRRVYITTFDSASASIAVVLLTTTNISTSAPSAHPLESSVTPNPFNPRTPVRFTLPSAAEARRNVFDARGR